MSFLDPKEEVLQIILTQHGRKMLANGNFRPTFFAFSDDGVDYQVSSFSQLSASIVLGPAGDGLLSEGGSFLLTEDGDFIILE